MKQFAAMILLACAAFAMAGDEWMTSGKDIAYPQELYFVGIGMSERSQDAAKQNAMIEVRKEISVSVSATMLDEQYSISSAGKETSGGRTESRARLSTSGRLVMPINNRTTGPSDESGMASTRSMGNGRAQSRLRSC